MSSPAAMKALESRLAKEVRNPAGGRGGYAVWGMARDRAKAMFLMAQRENELPPAASDAAPLVTPPAAPAAPPPAAPTQPAAAAPAAAVTPPPSPRQGEVVIVQAADVQATEAYKNWSTT